MSNTLRARIPFAGGLMLAAPRHVWLATLGAAAFTRDWAQREAGTTFRTLVKEGAELEARTLHDVGARVEHALAQARAWSRSARARAGSSFAAIGRQASALLSS